MSKKARNFDNWPQLWRLIFLSICLIGHSVIYADNFESQNRLNIAQNEPLIEKRAIKIGILAPKGKATAFNSWSPWIAHLNEHLPQYDFTMQALNLDEFDAVANSGEVDLILGHQASFLSIQPNVSIRWIASLKRNLNTFNQYSEIGSAIWVTKASGIESPSDLKGKRVSAVSPNAFGGFLLAYKHLYDEGLEAPRDYEVIFTGYPIEQGILLLEKGEVDATIAPTCMFEHMVKNGELVGSKFRLLSPYPALGGCLSSTPLLHNWSLAALPSLDEHDAQRIRQFLFSEQDERQPTWGLPVGLGEVFELQKLSGLIKVDETLWQTVIRLANTYKIWLMGILLGMFLLMVNHLWLTWTARRQRIQLETVYHTLHEYEEMLSRADRLYILGEIASGIGHELNQPLMAIRNYAEGSAYGLKKGGDPTEFIGPMERIAQQVEHCNAIIKNLQAWAKPKQGHQMEWVDLQPFILRIIEMTRLQNKNRVQIDVNIDCHQTIFTVISILEQVITNTLLNAVQAGANHIIIEAKCERDYYKILITDNGSGFSEEILDAPFVPFRTTKQEGLGLGLVICERLIASIGGKFRLANRKDAKGAAIRIILPSGHKCPYQREELAGKENDDP